MKDIREKIITKIVMRLGASPSTKGFTYIKAGIRTCLEDPKAITAITKVIYPEIAKVYDTTPVAVEHAIRHAITQGWAKRDLELSDDIFTGQLQSKKDIPTNSVFLAAVVEWLKMNE